MKSFGNVCYVLGVVVALGAVTTVMPHVTQSEGGAKCSGYKSQLKCSDDSRCTDKIDWLDSDGVTKNTLAEAGFGALNQCTAEHCGGPFEESLYDDQCTTE